MNVLNKSAMKLTEHRCECGKLLFKAADIANVIEIKCRRCGKVNLFGDRSRTYHLTGAGSKR